MSKQFIGRSLAVIIMSLAVAMFSGCQSTEARPAALTGEEQAAPAQHERHATGIESQARDF
jgi:hypothetical protein